MIVVAADFHIPYHDPKAVDLLIKFCRGEKAGKLIINGDFIDFYAISSFDRDPKRITELQEDINKAKEILLRLKRAIRNVTYLTADANHENRLKKFLWKKAPELSSLKTLEFKNLMELEKLGIRYVDHPINVGKFLIMHGEVVRKFSSYSAKAAYEKTGTDTIISHVHRQGLFYKTDMNGITTSYETGCLCDLHPEWIRNPDWQQGFLTIHGNHAQTVLMDNYEIQYGKKKYKL